MEQRREGGTQRERRIEESGEKKEGKRLGKGKSRSSSHPEKRILIN